MASTNIINYNNYLIQIQKQIDIIEYVKEVNKIEYNIDIDFIDEFIELVSKNECCIHHNLLQKYGICNLKGQKRYITKKKEQLTDYIEIKTLECVPNASTLWNLVKENLRNINFMGNKINLVDITEDDFISSIEEIYNERKNI
jgi:hypothetical protein